MSCATQVILPNLKSEMHHARRNVVQSFGGYVRINIGGQIDIYLLSRSVVVCLLLLVTFGYLSTKLSS